MREMAEGAIAQAIEDGVPAATVHDEVIEPALRRLAALRERGELDAGAERLAMGIARRVLATLHRYMLGGEAQPEVLERIDRSVQAVEGQLATREHAVGRARCRLRAPLRVRDAERRATPRTIHRAPR